MAAYYYAAYFNTPLHQSPADLSAGHPLGISSHPSDLPITPAKSQPQNHIISPTERRILFANGKIDPQEDSLFFRLPAELRNQIYDDLLCPCTPSIKDLAHPPNQAASTKTPQLYPSILSTCRRIHEEATDLLYTTHVFHAHPSLLTSLPHLTSSAKPVLYPAVLAKIRRWQLTIRLDTDPRFTMAQATAAFSGAEFLEIRVWQSMFDGCDPTVLKLFLGVRGVKVAKVCGSSNIELMRWLEERMMSPVEEAEKEELCRCQEEGRVVKCGECGKKVEQEEQREWFGGRNVWQFGNR
ncbi:hypothetical protein IQ06DRAFT_68338 [Phaeosphaeriaceae sp. SRC1lsM3a]|nr:hypothetical protein IQ06DRAFT_68338 [Stagonospora sp. SRC1lsM3a]